MPRQARNKSESGIYHIMLRGINQQQIFEDDEDNQKFLEIIKEYKAVCEYKIYAYCLMGNHVHILLQEGKEELQQIMKRIGGKYVYWYNTKYKRVGHLFQDRYKSEPIDDEKYLLTVIRYIHQNPQKAKIVEKISEYQYSSYKEYMEKEYITDTKFALGIMGLVDFVEFHEYENNDQCLDVCEKKYRLTDEEAKKIIKKLSGCENATEFQNIETKKRNRLLKKFRDKGLSIRQIVRLTGISKGIVERT